MFTLFLAVLSIICVKAEWSYIRHTASGLLLDATDETVKLQYFAGSPAQRWEEEHIGQGQFYIKNQKNGKFLTIRGGIIEKADIITYKKENIDSQKWYINSNGTIVSSDGDLALGVLNSNVKSNQKVAALPTSSRSDQIFFFQPQN